MAFTDIDITKPAGDEKISTADNYIRALKIDTEANLMEISGYPNNVALKTAVWTTATRPTLNLVDRLEGYNETLGCDEYYDLATTTWISKGTNTVMISFIQTLIDAVVPIGTVTMWSGSIATIPAKWHLCDGTNGTHNMMDKFVVGAGSGYAVTAVGGEATHILTVGEMPYHNHTMSGNNNNVFGFGGPVLGTTQDLGASTTNPIGYAGNNEAHENRPPYFALAYIQRIS